MTDKYNIDDLINFATNQQPIEFADAFNTMIVDKLHNSIEDRKVEIAKELNHSTSEE